MRVCDRQARRRTCVRTRVLPAPASNQFRFQEGLWTLVYGGRALRLQDALGLRYLARLLQRSSHEVHCIELASLGRQAGAGGHAGELLDRCAQDDYRQRLQDLHGDLAESESWGNAVAADRARTEIDALTCQLASAFGLGGRSRRAADDMERARKAVSNRVRASIARIARDHPSLGRHLADAVRTGTFCAYEPERAVSWRLV